ncbi:NucA/NucB deoxyribonuclease domain-containing protein [Lentzea sp. NPDC004782]|uniref:NucA/NucB deoxyribonuclease domain-containing protein n=1 Tax=Lentzea sp. NPDC004782 TaxID=3154458 RepID=UPI0033A379B2
MDGKKINCDEYPFASTYQGGTSGGPVSGRLIDAKVNREGGIQLNNWYGWDRILDGDQFWVQLLGQRTSRRKGPEAGTPKISSLLPGHSMPVSGQFLDNPHFFSIVGVCSA